MSRNNQNIIIHQEPKSILKTQVEMVLPAIHTKVDGGEAKREDIKGEVEETTTFNTIPRGTQIKTNLAIINSTQIPESSSKAAVEPSIQQTKGRISIATRAVQLFQTKIRLMTFCIALCFPLHLILMIGQFILVSGFVGSGPIPLAFVSYLVVLVPNVSTMIALNLLYYFIYPGVKYPAFLDATKQ